MPEPKGRFNVSEIMHAIKRHFSRDVNLIIKNEDENEGEDSYPRLQVMGDKEFAKMIQEHQEKVKTLKQKFLVIFIYIC